MDQSDNFGKPSSEKFEGKDISDTQTNSQEKIITITTSGAPLNFKPDSIDSDQGVVFQGRGKIELFQNRNSSGITFTVITSGAPVNPIADENLIKLLESEGIIVLKVV